MLETERKQYLGGLNKTFLATVTGLKKTCSCEELHKVLESSKMNQIAALSYLKQVEYKANRIILKDQQIQEGMNTIETTTQIFCTDS